MGYSTSTSTIENRRELIGYDSLEAGQSTRWTTRPGRAGNLARQIREVLRIASQHPDQYPKLAEAAKIFKIEVPAHNVVQAVLRDRGVLQRDTNLPVRDDDLEGDEAPGGGGVEFGRPQARTGLTRAAQVIDAWIKHLPSNDLMHFPQTTLSTEELEELYRWARSRTPRLMFFVPEGSLTLSIAEDDVEAHSWHPAVAPVAETFPTL